MLKIYYTNYFTSDEQEKIRQYITLNSHDLELKIGMNYAVDVSDAIGRTASVDIEKL